MTPPLSRTVNRMPGRRRSRSRGPRGITSWYFVDSVVISIVLQNLYRSRVGRSSVFWPDMTLTPAHGPTPGTRLSRSTRAEGRGDRSTRRDHPLGQAPGHVASTSNECIVLSAPLTGTVMRECKGDKGAAILQALATIRIADVSVGEFAGPWGASY